MKPIVEPFAQMLPRVANPARGLRVIVMVGLMWLAGCATPVSVRLTPPQVAYREATVSALEGDYLSTSTRLVLRRYGLEQQFDKEPVKTLLLLHQKAETDDRRDLLCALSELNYLHAYRVEHGVKPWTPKDAPDYYFSSTLYAWLYLLSGTNEAISRQFDPRTQLATDLYNHALAKAFIATGDTTRKLELAAGPRALPQSPISVRLDQTDLASDLETFDKFLPADDFEVRGLSVRNVDPGLGSPLIGVKIKTTNAPTAQRAPVTLFLRGPESLKEWNSGKAEVTLELHSAFNPAFVEVAGQKIPLRTDTTAPLAHTFADLSPWDLGIARFLSAKETVKNGIYLTQPYRPGRIPVVLVHGTASSPLWWAEMLNTLRSDNVLREHFQFWLYTYNTGIPVPDSGADFRDALSNMVQQLDPEGKDPALRQMVVIGHSQGGLLAKMAVTDPGDELWRAVSDKSLDQIELSPELREIVERALFFKPVPSVTRVVFICTPHRGSYLANSFVRRLAARLMSLPKRLVLSPEETLRLKRELRLPSGFDLSTRTSLEGMSPDNPVLLKLADIPPVSGVTAHSIIAAKDPSKLPNCDDGVVKYSSSHVSYSKSELIVKSGHTCQDKPPAIEEVRRILLEHLDSVSAQKQ